MRKDYPSSYIIYKPHPDLEKGLRSSGNKENLIIGIADEIANAASIHELFNQVDIVAVLTSLGGFEALIRRKKVITYGFPFYAGWGLTEDKLINHNWARRRTRRLKLEELVYIALIMYPYYFSLKYYGLTEVENIIEEIETYKNKNLNLEQLIFRYWGIFKDQLKKNEYK